MDGILASIILVIHNVSNMIVVGILSSLATKAIRMIGLTRVMKTSLTLNNNVIDSINSQTGMPKWMTVVRMHPHLIAAEQMVGDNVHLNFHMIVTLETTGNIRIDSSLLLIEMEPKIGNLDPNIFSSGIAPIQNSSSSGSFNKISGLLSSGILQTNGVKDMLETVNNLSRISSSNAISVLMIGMDLGSSLLLIVVDAVISSSLLLIAMGAVISSSLRLITMDAVISSSVL